jgi:RimJ/RimL family protein N-acetyltransferase
VGEDAVVLLRTTRMTLRQFSAADVDNLVDLDSDAEVMHFITGGIPTSRSEIEDVILPRWLRYCDDSPLIGFWAADDRRTGEFLGWFHLRPGDGHSADEPEIGYRLRRVHWGKGLATEGARALVDAAFTRSSAKRVLAETMFVHQASRRVMEKAGLRLVREFRADWPYPIPGDGLGDVEYALGREEWTQAQINA